MNKSFAWEGTPIINYLFTLLEDEFELFHKELMTMHAAPSAHNLKPMQFAKTRLGKQNYTWVGEYRFWVWETNDWRMFVSNRQGISVEVRIDLNKTQVQMAWNDLQFKLGLKSQ